MHRLSIVACCTLVLTLLAGCGIKFADVQHNLPLPKQWIERNAFIPTAQYKYHIDEIPGRFAFYNPTTKVVTITPYFWTPPGGKVKTTLLPVANLLENKGRVYESMITKGASVQGSYLAFAAGFSSNSVAKVRIEDLMDSWSTPSKLNEANLKLILAYYNATVKGKVPAGHEAWWIQGALLSTIHTEFYSKIESNASGVTGDTLGVNGQVFNETKSSGVDYGIHITTFNMDLFLSPPDAIVEIPLTEAFERSKVRSALIDRQNEIK